MHAPIAPPGIFLYEAQGQGADGADGAGTAWAFGAGGFRVASALEIAVPTEHGVGRDDQVELAELYPGEAVKQCGEQRSIGPGRLWLVYLPLQYGELVAQGQDLQILRPITHRQQPYEAEGGRQGEVRQSQQHS
ncbi:hypothetical protein BX281_1629 [Streptomyces sp. Ag82_O1-15]|nr:hypothetical protein BX281_1629 [Streptomyces sp. Ag82_O1-15]